MEKIFSETVEIEGEKTRVIYDQGLSKTRTIRGTDLKDTRPFILTEDEVKKGFKVIRKGKVYRVAEIEESQVGFQTCFLEEWYEREDYLDQNRDD